MARPKKDGLEYFAHDVDASNDEKIESMEAIYGSSGYAFYFKLVERIYRNGGALDVSAAETRQILARKCLAALDEWEKMLGTALRVGLFDSKEYEDRQVLTSDGIKRRCSKVFEKREKMAKTHGKRVSAAETPPETSQEHDKVKESKVKESKGEEKERKGSSAASPPADPLFQNPDFVSAWTGWVQWRNASKTKLTDHAKNLNLTELKKLAGDDADLAIRIVNKTVERGWKGFFPLKEDSHGKGIGSGIIGSHHAKNSREFPEKLTL